MIRVGCRSSCAGHPLLPTLTAVDAVSVLVGVRSVAAARLARRARGLPIGRPRALSDRKVEQVLKLHEAGTPVLESAATFGVGRDTVYRVIRGAAHLD